MPMNQFGSPASTAGLDRAGFDAGLRAHMLRVYNYMAGGVALTGLIAWLAVNTALAEIVFAPGIYMLFMFSPLAFILALNFGINRMSSGTMQALFWAFCACMGVSMAMIFQIYTGASVARAFFITASTFAGMSLWGYSTKRDLTGLGAFLRMGVMGILIALMINLALSMFGNPSPMLQWMVSVVGVVVFTGLTAYHRQDIKQPYAEAWGVETNNKLAVMGALRLYLSFINAFQFMLNLTGSRR
jgi:uncharacterized protein